jgi:hypothetical protein
MATRIYASTGVALCPECRHAEVMHRVEWDGQYRCREAVRPMWTVEGWRYEKCGCPGPSGEAAHPNCSDCAAEGA